MGRATAHLFADEGARVGIVDLDAKKLEAVADEIRSAGREVWQRQLDVSDRGGVDAAVADLAAHWGRLDILVNNAGYAGLAPIDHETYLDQWNRTLAVNLESQVHLIRAALPHLRRSDAGRIVNIASTEGLGATRFNSPYTASKHGVVGLTRAMAVELGREGITVNAICPGPIETGMTAAIPDDQKATFARRRVPLRRYGDPEEVAQITLGLVLPSSSFLNGAVIPVDGGLHIKFGA